MNATSIDEPLEKRELHQAISQKEKELSAILEKVEKLKIDLSLLKQEYDIKIGRLYLKIDELDLEIVKYKRIEDMLEQGSSFWDAQKLVEETLKEHHEHIKDEYCKFDEEEKDFKSHKIISDEEQAELKKLFRKLAHKFHPDLTGGDDSMMKKINKAYAGGDLEALLAIDLEESVVDREVTTIELLKLKLVKLEKSIKRAIEELVILENSEWSILNKNIERTLQQKRNLLDDLKDNILTEIAKKENHLAELKKKYEQG